MRQFIIYLCLWVLAFGGQPQLLKAQEITDAPSWSLQFNTLHQDVLLRYDIGQLGVTHDVKIRPAFSLEAQKYLKVKAKSRLFANAQLGHYRNLYHERWNSLQLGLGWERTIVAGLFVNLRIAAGVAHTRSADPQYVYENGEWIPQSKAAQQYFALLMGPRLDLGYRFDIQGHAIDLIATSQSQIHYNQILQLH